jgi:hypothetical protein
MKRYMIRSKTKDGSIKKLVVATESVKKFI